MNLQSIHLAKFIFIKKDYKHILSLIHMYGKRSCLPYKKSRKLIDE